ncbi:hypothetical protein EV177_006304, partial [Coemansia sp. RSA 1804]
MSDLPQPTDPIGEHPERGSYVTPVHSQAQSVAMEGHLSTPSVVRVKTATKPTVAHADDPEKADRRDKITKALEGKVDNVTPLVLFKNLGLAASYHAFNAAASAVGAGAPAISEGSSGGVAKGLFDDIASIAPTILGNNLQYPMPAFEDMVGAKLVKESGESHNKGESALTAYFMWLQLRMESADKSAWPGVKQKTELVYIDNQNKPVPGSNVKPDGVYYFEHSIPKSFKTAHIIVEAKWKTMDTAILPDVLGQI